MYFDQPMQKSNAKIKNYLIYFKTEKGKRKKSCDKTAERVAEQTSALRSHSRASGILQQKIEILLKLKSLKLQPETLRKMEFNMINIDYKGK